MARMGSRFVPLLIPRVICRLLCWLQVPYAASVRGVLFNIFVHFYFLYVFVCFIFGCIYSTVMLRYPAMHCVLSEIKT